MSIADTRRTDRREDPLRTLREGRTAEGDGSKYYDEYGFSMTPEQYDLFHGVVTDQQASFESQREEMMDMYAKAANPYKEELEDFIVPFNRPDKPKGSSGGGIINLAATASREGIPYENAMDQYNKELKEFEANYAEMDRIWNEQDLLTIHVPYKGRTGSLGQIPKSMYKDFVNSIQSAKHLGKRTSISAPLAEDVPGYIEKLYEAKELYDAGIADYNRAKGIARDAFELSHRGEDRDSFMYEEPVFTFNREVPGAKELEEARQIKLDAGYREQRYLGPGNMQFERSGADALIKHYEDLNTRGDLSFFVSDKDYYKSLFYEMPNVTAGVKDQWGDAVRTQYEDTRQSYEQDLALLDNELASAEIELQGYMDEFDIGVGQYAEQYQSELSAREEAFKSF